MGRLIKSKSIGKNIRVQLYYFQDGYRIYALRRKYQGKDIWIESYAADYPIVDKNKALEKLEGYKTIDDVLVIHPVLRDKGTWAVAPYPYKLEREVKKLRNVV
jgi:hypothetical protein